MRFWKCTLIFRWMNFERYFSVVKMFDLHSKTFCEFYIHTYMHEHMKIQCAYFKNFNMICIFFCDLISSY